MADATRVKVERCAKRLRVYIGGEIIADFDSRQARLGTDALPHLLFPGSRRAYGKAIAPSARHCSAKRATSTCGTETV